jgi:hypothetical protein
MVFGPNSGSKPPTSEAPPIVLGSVGLPALPAVLVATPPLPLPGVVVCPPLLAPPLLEFPPLEFPAVGEVAATGSPLPQANKPIAAITREIAVVLGASFMVPPL